MGREVRRVPADWQHPKAFNVHRQRDEFVPMHEGGAYAERVAEWDEGYAKWQEGLCRSYGEDRVPRGKSCAVVGSCNGGDAFTDLSDLGGEQVSPRRIRWHRRRHRR